MARKSPLCVALPPGLKAWVEQQVSRGKYADVDECIELALRRAHIVHTREELEAKALEGVRSGRGTALNDRAWVAIAREVEDRARERGDPLSRAGARDD